MKVSLQLQQVSVKYGENTVLSDFSLDVAGGELIALLGASGCGKSTVLKVVAGLVAPDTGAVFFGGDDVTNVAADKRGAVLMFQKPLLFPYMSVAENVGFGLKMRQVPKAEITARVAEALRMVQLENFETCRPRQLSGGQEQRVALARALVTNPRILLLDEPFTALDANLRVEMRRLVRNLQQEFSVTTVFVTHDQIEAAHIADRIAFMHAGQIEQFAAPREFYINPQTINTARFFGWKICEGKQNGNSIETAVGTFTDIRNRISEIQKPAVGFHPAQVKIVAATQSGLAALVESSIDLGARGFFVVKLSDGDTIEIETTENDFAPRIGEQVSLQIAPENVKIFV